MYITHTAYTASLFNCYSEMIEKYSQGKTEDATVTDRELDKNLEMVIPALPSKTLYSLLEKYRKTSEISYARKMSLGSGDLSVNINDFTRRVFQSSVIELGSMTFEDAIKFCNTVIKDDIESFYGVLMFENKNSIINPFHPLVASSMVTKIKANKKELNKTYRVVLFGSTLDKKINNLYEFGKECYPDVIKENIAHQMAIYQEDSKLCTINKMTQSPEDLLFQASLGKFSPLEINRLTSYYGMEHDDDSIEFVSLIPVHIGVRGIAFPWYGSVLAWRGKVGGSTSVNTYGVQLSPFLSANVGYRNGELTSNELVYNDMCTGSYDRSKIEGIRTINRANFDSPLCKFGVESGWIVWKDECVKTSLEIYSEMIDLTVKPKKLSYKEQWLNDNPSLNESDYLVHLSQKLTTHKEPSVVVTSTPTSEHSVLDTALAGFRTVAENEAIMTGLGVTDTDELFNSLFDDMTTTAVTAQEPIPTPINVERPTPRRRRRRNPETGELE